MAKNEVSGYSFDGNGNPTTYGGSSFVFDAENRPTTVGSTLTASYGVDDTRASKTDGSGTTYYLYANNSTVPTCELNSSGTVTATNTYTVNGLVSRKTSSGSTFYEFDEQGNVSERLNSSGSCTSSSIADAFGVVTNSSSVSDPFGYVGQAGYITDQATGLILTTHRYYDPGSGRFLNRDPSGYSGGIDLYGYVQNNAENGIDPLGYGGAVGSPIIQSPGTPGYPTPPGHGPPNPPPGPCPTCCVSNPFLDYTIASLMGSLIGLTVVSILLAFPELAPWSALLAKCLKAAIPALATILIQADLDSCGDIKTSDVEIALVAAGGTCLMGLAGEPITFGPWEPIKFST